MTSSNLAAAATRAAPLVFVLLWSTGFIGAKLGLPYIEPFTLLAIRFLITIALLAPFAWHVGRGLDSYKPVLHSMVSGVLVHAVYLGGVFFAISRGMPAGISALVVALQPMATAFIARAMLGERLNPMQIAGLVLGILGVTLVVAPRLAGGADVEGVNPVTMTAVVVAMLAISLGAVYQKKFVTGLDLRVSTAAQYVGAVVPLGIASLLLETRQIEWTGELVFALAWLIFVLSIGAVGLLMWLIRMNSAAGTASLFYLVPAATALIAWALFGEVLVPIQLVGMVVVMAAVAIATRAATRKAAR